MNQESKSLGLKGTPGGSVPIMFKEGDTFEIIMGNPNHVDFITQSRINYANGEHSILFVNKSDGVGTIIVNRV